MIFRPKHQRLVLIVIALVAVAAAVLLAMWGLRDRAAYFYTPAEVAGGKAAEGQSIRIGGMVEAGSIQRLPDGVTIRFTMGGRHVAEFMGVPATGTQIQLSGITTLRFAGDRVIERHSVADMLGLLVQLGAVPAPA